MLGDRLPGTRGEREERERGVCPSRCLLQCRRFSPDPCSQVLERDWPPAQCVVQIVHLLDAP